MADEMSYRIRFRDLEFEYEVEGDQAFVEEQSRLFYERYEQSVQRGGRGRGRGPGRPPLKRSAVEPAENGIGPSLPEVSKALQGFLREAKPTGGPDIALAAAYHLVQEGGLEEFTTRDLTRLLDTVRNVSVGNMSLAVRRAVERGFVEEHKPMEGGRSSYSMTPLGLARVESNFA